MHTYETRRPAAPPPLPTRAPVNRAMAAALRLWRESECYDRATVERCLEGLRSLDAPAAEQPTVQHEVDGVIARWRAEHPEVRRAS
ncbi:hypothetical protein [Nocardia sp. CA-290969]|uniref:hypothetical protein n=1 Tax=Nocardia sp. CA-290969 TaxID=3239986 RepID=UPI003D948E4D